MSINESIYEIASKPLISIDINEYVSNAVKFMYERGLRRLAVKQNDQITGIFNISSLLKILLEGTDPSNLTLSMVELESPIYVGGTTPIKDAVDLMNKKEVTSILVGKANDVQGILTTHDIISVLSSTNIKKGVYGILDKDYPSVDIGKSKVIDVMREMVDKNKSGIFIFDGNEYVGIITIRDIIKIYSDLGSEGLNSNLNDIPINEGAYGSIGLSISELASIMYNKGSDVIAVFCSYDLCGGIDDLILTRNFNKIIEGID
ncbi:putative transcriptional regulator, contains C-terminal CBS domains [Caldisphaera lagunensis DSM 15908]|uniref:Putative transcriptional regulator, contains C-terminal CBS domains n=1 Tax=Caldisphaera lagunensis (strain DSM 15908 / JCM 11604 / ANMR 0165 / IC-154) TaxID=1056495 RepID=L0ADY3_CALLD|nr:CBS domain-containing protein [Caldisphaera lagunensis]AFZ71265.1 putative transcriptional regulator, contains C-terminal CBS domains [Caldisphaera lagunensis DSM 15908]